MESLGTRFGIRGIPALKVTLCIHGTRYQVLSKGDIRYYVLCAKHYFADPHICLSQVIAMDGSEISLEGPQEVRALGAAAFAQVTFFWNDFKGEKRSILHLCDNHVLDSGRSWHRLQWTCLQ